MATGPQPRITLPSDLGEAGPPRADRRLLLRAGLCAVLVVLMTAGTTVAAVLLQVQDVVNIVKHGQPAIPRIHSVLDNVAAGKPQTILLLGSDHRYGDPTQKDVNSDTILLVHLDPSQPATTIFSVPRDLKVSIPGHGQGKINSAFGLGGPVLTAKTVENLLGLPIHHVFVTTFTAFAKAVDAIGCVYSQVDHRYYVPPNAGYAKIDLQAGYQKLCGNAALSFVRFRHADTDFVRSARQQAFLRAAVQQARVSGLIGKVKKLVRVLADYTQTDVRSTHQILRLLKLGIESVGHPVTQITFPAILSNDPTDTYVYDDPGALQAAVHQFLHPSPPKRKVSLPHPRKHHASKPVKLQPIGGQAAAAQQLHQQAHFKILHLEQVIPGSTPALESPRAYRIRDRAGVGHAAFYWSFALGPPGQYYGLQGTTWRTPPLLQEATGTTKVAGRTATFATSGGHIIWLAWREGRGLYWITNTLTRDLSNKQMLALAAAARG
jgi:LCP family protein required for cell wall assembly